jgi:small subunit ribosomal protein S9
MPEQYLATGRRKKAVARVSIKPGTGKFAVNGRSLEDYFCLETLRIIARQPITLAKLEDKYDISANVYGGGYTGQAGAVKHGLARALIMADPSLRGEIKKAGYLTRDSRMIERKKYGLKKARRAPQFSKR